MTVDLYRWPTFGTLHLKNMTEFDALVVLRCVRPRRLFYAISFSERGKCLTLLSVLCSFLQ